MALGPRSVVGALPRCSCGLSAFASQLHDCRDRGVLCVARSTRSSPRGPVALEGCPGRPSCSPLQGRTGLHTTSFHSEAAVGG